MNTGLILLENFDFFREQVLHIYTIKLGETMVGKIKLFIFLGLFSLYISGCSERIAAEGSGTSVDDISMTGSAACSGMNTVAFVVKVFSGSSNSNYVQNASVTVTLGGLPVGQVQQVSQGTFEIRNLADGGPYTLSVSAANYDTAPPETNIFVQTQGAPCFSAIQQSDRVIHLTPTCIGIGCVDTNLGTGGGGTGLGN